MKRTPTLVLLVSAIFSLWLACAGCSAPAKVRSVSAHETPAAPVSVASVSRQDLAREIELAAEFRAYQEIDLHAKVSGYLKAIYVDVGDRVRQGQLLAVLEVPELAQEQAQAIATLKRTGLEVERAKGDLKRVESSLHIRKLSYDRLLNVIKTRPNLVAQQEIDDAAARMSDAEAQLMAAKASLAASEEQIQVAHANKARIDVMLSYLQITAPFAGVITQRRGDPGALVQAGTTSSTQAMPVVRLSQVDRLRLVLPVPESIVPRVGVGSPVEVRVDSLGRIFQGKIARFTGRLDTNTRTMDTEVDLPNAEGVIKPGMYGYAVLRLDQRERAIAVPVQAVSGHGASASVMVVDGKRRLQERRIEAGIETPGFIEVVSGLKENELVVLGSRSKLKTGTLVDPKVISEIETSAGH